MRPLRPPVLVLLVATLACRDDVERHRVALERDGHPFRPESFVAAAQRGDLPVVERFLLAGMSPDAEAPDGRTPLVAAAGAGHLPVARTLLDRGASPKGCSRSVPVGTLSPLFAAAVRGDVEGVSLLLERGADPREACGGTTVADEAARFGREPVVKLLVARGAVVVYDPLRDAAREAGERFWSSAESLARSFVARGAIRRVLEKTDFHEVVATVARHRYYLAQLLAVDVGRRALLATNATTFQVAGRFALRVRDLGPVATPEGEVPLLVEDVHHEAALYLHDHVRRGAHRAYLEYLRHLLPAAIERVASGPGSEPRAVAERALAALPAVVEEELERTGERSRLVAQLPGFARALGSGAPPDSAVADLLGPDASARADLSRALAEEARVVAGRPR